MKKSRIGKGSVLYSESNSFRIDLNPSLFTYIIFPSISAITLGYFFYTMDKNVNEGWALVFNIVLYLIMFLALPLMMLISTRLEYTFGDGNVTVTKYFFNLIKFKHRIIEIQPNLFTYSIDYNDSYKASNYLCSFTPMTRNEIQLLHFKKREDLFEFIEIFNAVYPKQKIIEYHEK